MNSIYVIKTIHADGFFYSIENCSNRPLRFALFGCGKNYDSRAHRMKKQSVTRFYGICNRLIKSEAQSPIKTPASVPVTVRTIM